MKRFFRSIVMEGDDVFLLKSFVILSLQRRGIRMKVELFARLSYTFFFFFLISIIITTHSFSGTHKQSHHFEKLEGEDWAAWNSKCNSSILAILTSLNLQIHVMYCRTAKFFTFMTHSVIKDKICIVFFKIQIGHKQLLEVNIRLEITSTKSTCYLP